MDTPKSAAARARVRPARPEEDAALGELLVEAFVQQYGSKRPDFQIPEARRASLRAVAERRQVAAVLVAEVDGRLAGTVSLWRPGAAGSEAWVEGAADLRQLAVAPEYFGQGLSGPLLEAAEQQAWEWGAPAVCLHVRRGLDGVARLYTRRGYVRAPEGDLVLYGGIHLEAYVLWRPSEA